MRLRLLSITAFLGVAILFAGCGADREMQADLVNLKSSTKKQLDLLKQQNQFLNRKLNTVNEKVDELTELTTSLRTELSTYANRPEEVKLEIINEVNTRFAAIAKNQDEFKEQVQTAFQDQSKKINDDLATELEAMNKTLNKHTAFVQFVAAEQDSINRVFANRFDSRPWYQSIIGKWEDRERAATNTP
jgi:DNA anti-recombination protein RmuC